MFSTNESQTNISIFKVLRTPFPLSRSLKVRRSLNQVLKILYRNLTLVSCSLIKSISKISLEALNSNLDPREKINNSY